MLIKTVSELNLKHEDCDSFWVSKKRDLGKGSVLLFSLSFSNILIGGHGKWWHQMGARCHAASQLMLAGHSFEEFSNFVGEPWWVQAHEGEQGRGDRVGEFSYSVTSHQTEQYDKVYNPQRRPDAPTVYLSLSSTKSFLKDYKIPSGGVGFLFHVVNSQ